MNITLTYKLNDPKKHSIRAKCTSHEGASDYYVHREILDQLGAKFGDTITMVLSKEKNDGQGS